MLHPHPQRRARQELWVRKQEVRTAALSLLVAAIQAVVVPVAAPAVLDAALVVALELLSLAQLGQHLRGFT